MHRIIEPVATAAEVGRKAVIEQIHPDGVGPASLERIFDRADGMGECMNECDTCHGVVVHGSNSP